MKTQEKTYETIAANAKTVDTTTGLNGYPEHLRVAYTADTLGELRELHDSAIAAGHDVAVVRLHRRDGWALWERNLAHDLEDDAYMGQSDSETVISVTNESDKEEEAFACICGHGYEVTDADNLKTIAKMVQDLAEELPEPDELEDGEEVRVFIDTNNYTIDYTVRTGQNGYAYDTHHYCTGLLIKEREEEEEDEEA